MKLMRGLTIVMLAALSIGCRQARTATYDMTWSYEDDHTCSTMRHVILHWVDYPNYEYGYCSTELGKYLESLSSTHVPVVFEVYEPSAQLGGGDPIKIGTLTKWKSEFSHMGQFQDSVTQAPLRHPWEQFRH